MTRPDVAYRFLAWLLRTITRVFFRQIEVVGLEHVPATGPVLFAGNHPNSLIDPDPDHEFTGNPAPRRRVSPYWALRLT